MKEIKFRNPLESGEESEPVKGPSFKESDTDLDSEVETRDIGVLDREKDPKSYKEYFAEDEDEGNAETEDSEAEEEPKTLWEKFRRLTDWIWRDPVTEKPSWIRISQAILYFLVFAFLVNAAVVTTAFWKAGTLSSGHISFTSIRLTKLDANVAFLDISGQLEDTFLMNRIHFKFTKPLETTVLVKNPSTSEEFPFVSFTIPEGELVDTETRKFSVKNIEITFTETFPMDAFENVLAPENFGNAKLKDIVEKLPNFVVNMNYGVSTHSFWIPARFSSTQQLDVNTAGELKSMISAAAEDSETKIPDFKPKNFEFNQNKDSFFSSGHLSLPREIFPAFLYVAVPALNWELRQKSIEPVDEAAKKFTFSKSHKMLTFEIPKQTLDGSLDNVDFNFKFLVDEHDRRGISELLGAFRDDETSNAAISVAHNSKAISHCLGLCKWLAPFEINVPLKPMINSLVSFKADDKSSLLDSFKLPVYAPLFEASFEGVKNSSDASFLFTFKSDLSFLPFESMIDFKTMFKQPFPEQKALLKLDNGTDREAQTLITLSVNHVVTSAKVLQLELTVTLNNLAALTRSSLDLVASSDVQTIFLSGSEDTFLTSLLVNPLAVEIDSVAVQPRFRHGKKLALQDFVEMYSPTGSSTTKLLSSVDFSDVVKHSLHISTATTTSNFTTKGHFKFSDTVASKLPFIKISWRKTDFSFTPTSLKKGTKAFDLASFRLSDGSFHMYIADKRDPLLLVHDGFLNFSVESGIKSKKSQKPFLKSWKTFARDLLVPDAPNFVPIVFRGRTGEAAFVTPAVVPTKKFLTPIFANIYQKSLKSAAHKLPENWSNWFKSLAETTVKFSGMRGLTNQLLIELPQMEISSMEDTTKNTSSIDVRVEMTTVDLNICRRNRKSDVYDLKESPKAMNKSGLSNQACLLQVGLQPMTYDISIVNGSICGISTSASNVRAYEDVDEEELLRRESIKNLKSAMEKNSEASNLAFSPAEDSTSNNPARLVNLIPVNVSLIDLDGLIQFFIDVSENSWDGIRMSLGRLPRERVEELGKVFEKADSLMFNQILNTLGSLFAFSAQDGLVYLTKSTRKKSAPAIEKFNYKDSMIVDLDIKSPNRNLLVGSLLIEFPESSIPSRNDEIQIQPASASASETDKQTKDDVLVLPENVPVNIVPLSEKSSDFPDFVLVNMRWGDMNLKIAHKSSFLELSIPEGCLGLRVHKVSGAVSVASDGSSYDFSREIGASFRIFMDFEHMSSSTLRSITDGLSLIRKNEKTHTKIGKTKKKLVQKRELDMNLILHPHSLDSSHQVTHTIKSTLPVSTLVHLFLHLKEKIEIWTNIALKSTLKKMKKRSFSSSKLPEITVTPIPLQSSVVLPCLVPILCTEKQMKRGLSKDLRLMKLNIEIERVIQGFADGVGHVVGVLMEKLNFSQHPAKMSFSFKSSAVAFGMAVNGVEALEVEVDPIFIQRDAAVIYSGSRIGYSLSDVFRKRQNDSFEFRVLTKLSPGVKNLQQVLSPVALHPDDGLVTAPIPAFHSKYLNNSAFIPKQSEVLPKKTMKKMKKKLRKYGLHHTPLVVSLQNEYTRHSSLLSSLVAFCIPSFNLGPLNIDPEAAAEALKKSKIPKPVIRLEHSDEIDLTVKIGKIVIPNPLPLSVNIKHRIGLEIRHKGFSFIRASIDGKSLHVKAGKPVKLSAHLILSKNAFGKLPADKSNIFRDFLSDLAFGKPVKFDVAIHIGKKHSLHLPVGLGVREISTALFNADKVDVDFYRPNYVVEPVVKTIVNTFKAGKSVLKWAFGVGNGNDAEVDNANDPGLNNDLLSEIRHQFKHQAEEEKLRQQDKKEKRIAQKKRRKNRSSSSSESDSDSSNSSSDSSDSWKTVDRTKSRSSNSDSSSGSGSSNSSNTSSSNSNTSSSSNSSSSGSNSSSSTTNSSSSKSEYYRHKRSDTKAVDDEVEDDYGAIRDNETIRDENDEDVIIKNEDGIVRDEDKNEGLNYVLPQPVNPRKGIPLSSSYGSSAEFEHDNNGADQRGASSDSDEEPVRSPICLVRRESTSSVERGPPSLDRMSSPTVGLPLAIDELQRSPDDISADMESSTFNNICSDSSQPSIGNKVKGFFKGLWSYFPRAIPYDAEEQDGFFDDSSDETQSLSSENTFYTAPEIPDICSYQSESYNSDRSASSSSSEQQHDIVNDPSVPEVDSPSTQGANPSNSSAAASIDGDGLDNAEDGNNGHETFEIDDEEEYDSDGSTLSAIVRNDIEPNLPALEAVIVQPKKLKANSKNGTCVPPYSKNQDKYSNSSSTSSSSSSSSSGSSSRGKSASISRGNRRNTRLNPIRRTRENQFVDYYSDSAAEASSDSDNGRKPNKHTNKDRRPISEAPRIFDPIPDQNDENSDGPTLHLREIDPDRAKKANLVDTSGFKNKMPKHYALDSSNSSSSDSNSSSSNSSSSSSSSHKKKKKKKKHKKHKKTGESETLPASTSDSRFFTIERDSDPAADNPINSPSSFDQIYFTLTNLANHVRVRLFFVNPSEFPVYVLGANMQMFIDDRDMLWSTYLGGRLIPYSYMQQRVEGRLFIAPKNCRPKSVEGMRELSPERFLKCCYDNRSKPVEVVQPEAETEVSAFVYLKNSMSSLQVLDEMNMHDGLCIHIADSPVSVAVEAYNGRPFVIEMMAHVPDQVGRPRKYGDPCRLETKCLPSNLESLPIGEAVHVIENGYDHQVSINHIDLYNPNVSSDLFSQSSENAQVWRRKPVDLATDFEISVRLETRWLNSQTSRKSHFSFVFAQKVDFAAGTSSHSVALILDPASHTISLFKDGDIQPLMFKEYGSFPNDMAAHPVLLTIRHRPHQQKMIITAQPEIPTEPGIEPFSFTTVFPVNLGSILGVLKGGHNPSQDLRIRYKPAEKTFIALAGTSARFHTISFLDWKLNSILPDLTKSSLFFDKTHLAPVNHIGRVYLQLRDSCGKVINGLASDKIQIGVQMRLVGRASRRKADYDAEEMLLSELDDNDYSIHHQPDTRPSTKTTKIKHGRNKKHRRHPSNSHFSSLAGHISDDYWLTIRSVKHIPHFGVYQVEYVADISGRYEVYISLGKKQNKNDSDSSSDSSSSSSSSSSKSDNESDKTSKSNSSSKSSKDNSSSSKEDSSSNSNRNSSSSQSSNSTSDSTCSTSFSSSKSSTSSNSESKLRKFASESSSSSSSSSSSDDEIESHRLGHSKFKSANGYKWTRLNTYNLYVPSAW